MVFVELLDEGETVAAAVGTAIRDVLMDERTAEEDCRLDGAAGWTAVLGLVFPGETPLGAGEMDVGDGLDPGTTVAVPVLRAGAGPGITVPVGLVSVTVYTTVPVTTVSVTV